MAKENVSPSVSFFYAACREFVGKEPFSSSSLSLAWYHISTKAAPYAELVRLWKPIGFLHLYFPCLFSSLLAASLAEAGKAPLSFGQLIYVNAVFFVGSFMVRSFGCTWNDICDQNLDRHVARTAKRPLARRAVPTSHALVFAAAQFCLGVLTVLSTLPLACFWLAAPSIVLGLGYPLAKRVTNYPQAVLGLTFSWGVWLIFEALDQQLLHSTRQLNALPAALCLYLACTVWTIIYDMVYAAQDARDDRQQGIGSIFVRFADKARLFFSAMLIFFDCLLLLLGYILKATWWYYTFTCGATTILLAYMIWDVDLTDSTSCLWWFSKGSPLVSGAIAVGLGLEYWSRHAMSATVDAVLN